MKHLFLCFCVAVFFLSCKPSPPKELLFDTVNSEEETSGIAEPDSLLTNETEVSWEQTREGSDVVVPFEENADTKIVDVKLNGVGLKMIFDTGASYTLISLAEAQYLYSKGTLTAEDILDTGHSQIADGSIVEHLEVNLREVVLGDAIVCRNVRAVVSNNVNAPLLLGNSVLNRAPAYTVDNENKRIIFHL